MVKVQKRIQAKKESLDRTDYEIKTAFYYNTAPLQGGAVEVFEQKIPELDLTRATLTITALESMKRTSTG